MREPPEQDAIDLSQKVPKYHTRMLSHWVVGGRWGRGAMGDRRQSDITASAEMSTCCRDSGEKGTQGDGAKEESAPHHQREARVWLKETETLRSSL